MRYILHASPYLKVDLCLTVLIVYAIHQLESPPSSILPRIFSFLIVNELSSDKEIANKTLVIVRHNI